MPAADEFPEFHPAAFLAERYQLPLFETDALRKATDILDYLATTREIVVFAGPKGAGKSFAVERRLAEFKEREAEAARASDTYRAAYTKTIHAPQMKRRRDVLRYLHREICGGAPVRRDDREDDAILDLIATRVTTMGLALLIVDECEDLTDVAYKALRDLNERGAQRAARLRAEQGGAANGVGILLLSTSEFGHRAETFEEAGQRLTRVEYARPLGVEDVAEIYRTALPCFAAYAERLRGQASKTEADVDPWVDYVSRTVVRGETLGLRFIRNHVKDYIRRLCRHPKHGPKIAAEEHIPWVTSIFEMSNEQALRRQYHDDKQR